MELVAGKEKIEYKWINIAKGIGIIFVVFGHSFPNSLELSGFSSVLYGVIYSFHMPLFFFLSGLVSAKIFSLITFKDKFEYGKKKFQRLMIPYFVWGMIYIPLRLIMAKYARFNYDFRLLYTIFIGNNPDGELWFLYVIFIFSILAALVYTKKNRIWITGVCLVLTVSSIFFTAHLNGISLQNSMFMVFFFGLGVCVSADIQWLVERVIRISIVIPAGFVFIAANLFLNRFGGILWKIPTALSGILIVCWLSIQLERCSGISKVLNELGKYTMDIYIFHAPIIVVLRILLVRILGIGDILYIICAFLCGILISYFASRFIVRKVRWLRLPLLGITK